MQIHSVHTSSDAQRYRAAGYWADRTFFDILAARAAELPDRVVFTDAARSITFGALKDEVERCAEFLRRVGIARGDVVTIQITNRIEFAVVFFSLELIGAIANQINPDFRAAEVGYLMRFTGSRAYICANAFKGFEYLPMIESLRPELPELCFVISVDDTDAPGVASMPRSIVACGPLAPEHRVRMSSGEPMRVCFTSGTTGNPKGSVHSFDTTIYAAELMNDHMAIDAEDVTLLFMPVGLNSGYLCLLQTLISRGRLVLMERFHPLAVLDAIERYKVTLVSLPPSTMLSLLQEPGLRSRDLSSLRAVRTGGSMTSTDMVRRFRDVVGVPILEAFGMLEMGFGTCIGLDSDFEETVGTAGPAMHGMGIAILDEAGREVADETEGEIAVRGPTVHLGYLNNPSANAQSLTADGWFRSGDVGALLGAGRNLKVIGRTKEIINRAGKKFVPREVEELLIAHPDVVNVALVGVPDERVGERVCACVVSRPGSHLELKDLLSFLKDRVATYKLPEMLVLRDALPLTATGKIRKALLVEEVQAMNVPAARSA
ncbi:MAG: class I adenylate-forming enzyme family protein [Pseudomonadota bacterium]